MTSLKVAASAILLAAHLSAPLFAHHSVSAVFDTNKQLTLKGTIVSVAWRNPHASLSIDVKDASGKITNWFVELAGVGNLTKAGLDQTIIDLNQTYSIEIFPAKDGSPKGVGLTLIFPDSRSFDVAEKPAVVMPAR